MPQSEWAQRLTNYFGHVFGKKFSMDYINSIDDLGTAVQGYGFLPMFRCGIRGYSVYEKTPTFWSDNQDGPWEWKGPLIREGTCAYGKFFNRKAVFISREWFGDFINYRRTKHLAPNEDAAAMDDIVLQTIDIEGQCTINDLRQLLGLGRRRRNAYDLADDTPVVGKVNLDTNLGRLMMEGRVCIADFIYNIDRRGNAYGWGIAKYTTPEQLYGPDVQAECPPQESYARIYSHLRHTLRASDSQIRRLLG